MADYKNNKMSEEESLKRSHSKFSNFKLTLICMLCALSVTVFAAALASIGTGILEAWIIIAAAAAGGLLTVLSLVLINKFRR